MAALSLTYTITNGTTEDATQVQQNYTDIVNYVNANVIRTDGANAMGAPLSTNNADPTVAAHAVRKGYLDGSYVLATGAVSQTFTASTWTTLKFATKVLDSTNGSGTNGATNYTLATGLYTVPTSGLYFVSFGTSLTNFTTNYQMGVLAGGTRYTGLLVVPSSVSTGASPIFNMSLAVYLTAAQTIEPQLNSSGTDTSKSLGQYLSIAWLHG